MDNDLNSNEVRDVSPGTMPPVLPIQNDLATPPIKRRSPKLLIGGIIAGLIVVLGGASALGYTLWYQNPDKVVHDAIFNVIQAKTISTTGTITYKDDGVAMDITLDGKSNEVDGELNVTAKVVIDTDEMKQDFDAKGTGRVIGDTLYVKITGIKTVVEDMMGQSGGEIPSYTTTIIDKIEDKWISIKASDYQEIDKTISDQQTCLTNLTKKVQSDKAMSTEVMELYRNNQIITINEELGSKSVNGVGSLGYKVELDKNATVSFTRGLSDTALGKDIKNCNKDIDFNEIADDIAKETTNNDDIQTAELWVSRFGHEVTEVSMKSDEDDSTLNIILQPVFNNEVSVEAPSDATSLKTVFEEIQEAMTGYYTEMYSEQSTTPLGGDDDMDFFQPAI